MENSLSFGTLFGSPPPARPGGSVFRIAYFADLSGRANRGEFDSSDDIAARKPIKIEFDAIDEVLEELQPRLRIPLAGGRAVAEFEFSDLESFDADSVLKSWSVVEEAQGIRRRIERSLEKAAAWIRGWHEPEDESSEEAVGSRAVTIPAVDSLDELSSLEGRATAGSDSDELSASELMEELCGPLLRGPARDRQLSSEKLLAAAAECVNTTARAVMHHPDFQALEGVWRELDWLLRRVDKGGNVQVLLFDLSAEEFAADVARHDDLSETGLYRLLVGKLLEGKNAQPPNLVVGRYEFDYCPAHAALLGRIASICQRLNAPFLSSMSSRLLDEKFKAKDDERLAAWNQLRALPAASHLALGLPGFLLRMPYGKQGRSAENFELEEVDRNNIAGSLLWGNAGTFCAALLAGGYLKEVKWDYDPNSHRVLDKVPLYVDTADDDERTAISTQVRFALSVGNTVGNLGLIPLQAAKDRDSIVVSQLRSLSNSGPRLGGAWTGTGAPTGAAPSQPAVASAPADTPRYEPPVTASSDVGVSMTASSAPSTGGLDPELAALLGEMPSEPAPSTSSSSGLDPELAALLGESPSSSPEPKKEDDGLDPELRALLGG